MHRPRPAKALAAIIATTLCLVSTARSQYDAVVITNVPHVRQKPDFCGEACVEMVLRSRKNPITQDDVFAIAAVPTIQGRGCYTPELVAAMKKIGFATGPVWHTLEPDNDAAVVAQWKALHADLLQKIPAIVCMKTGSSAGSTEHMRLVVGYDPAHKQVIYHAPGEDRGAFARMPLATFLKLWPLKSRNGQSFVIRIRCEPGRILEYTRPAGFTPADYAQHIRALKARLPEKGFHIIIQPPFVVVGDESPEMVARRAESTVAWAVSHLKRQYFPKDPDKILNVWLFKDKESYEKNARELLEENPTTPFGFCSSTTGDLIMNIATGGGTLVHEIVHPFMHANFRECPSWFNEGMGSLYEQASERDSKIIGLTNWRLSGLQDAIREKNVPSFRALTSTTASQFYNMDRGTNYAQARYLCYYLQEKGLLEKFYRSFLAGKADDPTGYKHLQAVLGEKDMTAFQKQWEDFVLKLRFP